MPPHTVEGSGAENIPPQGDSLLMTPHVRDDDVWKKKDLCVEDFKPVKAVGNGDMGTVFLVVHESTNMPYAMKVMKKDALVSKNTTIRAQTEKDILSSLQHPFLPSLLATFESEKHSFLVMDYCTGGDLNVLRQRQPEKIFSVSAARFYAAEVVLALEYLHKKGILYRDLKPENILVQADGHIMLTDFDLSLRLSERKSFVKEVVRTPEKKNKKKQQRPPSQIKSLLVCGAGGNGKKAPKGNILSRVTPVEATNPRKGGGGGNVQGQETEPRSNSFVGTVEYVAPEIIWGNGHSWQVDWWTLGVFLYEMVYGKTPFKSENGRKETFYNILTKTPEIPGPMSPLKDLLQKLLKKEPVERLGNSGADEIKNHPFFEGVQWSALQFVSRPPCVPPPLVIAEVEAEIERKRALHHEKSEGEIEREKMLKETFGDVSTDGKTTTPDLEEAADPATFQQRESAIVSSMPAKELNGSSTMMEERLQSASSIITSSVSWSGSEFVGSSRKIWSDTDGNQSSTEDESSLQVLKHMKRDLEPAEMIEYF
ncbi:hypothetical protein BDL97_08G120500 [Sphagnum fallax]|nr:hypothetical protein BDL97_08G120500 [Sphagnum fallax]